MHFRISQKDLSFLIGKTQHIAERRNLKPTLGHVLLEAQDGRLKIYATDLEVSMTDIRPAQVLVPGRLSVGSKALFEVIRELNPQEPVELQGKENNWLEIRQGMYQSKLVGQHASSFPIFPEVDMEQSPRISGDMLKEMIDKTIFCTAPDSPTEMRKFLNGVYFEEAQEGHFSMVGMDGHRLGIINRRIQSLGGQKLLPGGPGIIIPRKGLMEIRKMVEQEEEGEFQILVEGTQLILKKQEALLMMRLLEGPYPDYRRFFKKELPPPLLLPREKFLGCVKRIALFADQNSKTVRLRLSPGRAEITSNNPELGDAKEEIEVSYQGSEAVFGFNARFMQEALSALTGEDVELHVRDNQSPGLVKSPTDKDYMCIVMPMKV